MIASPTLDKERLYKGTVVGVDEAGRGALAGPVFAAAICGDRLPKSLRDKVRDSKLLSPNKREKLYEDIAQATEVGVGVSFPKEIDAINILHASLQAMRRAIFFLPFKVDVALIDGNHVPKDNDVEMVAIVKGDRTSVSIAAASIAAKVLRDRYMDMLAFHNPSYGWVNNRGYPTKAHRQALCDHGITAFHRRSYAPVQDAIRAHR